MASRNIPDFDLQSDYDSDGESDDDLWPSSSESLDGWSDSSSATSNYSFERDFMTSSDEEADIEDIAKAVLADELEWSNLRLKTKTELVDFLVSDTCEWRIKEQLVEKLGKELLGFRYPFRDDSILHQLSDVKLVEHLIKYTSREEVESLCKHSDKMGRTPLHTACMGGRSDLVVFFLSHVSDKDQLVLQSSDKFGTALHQAKCGKTASTLLCNSLQETTKQKLLFSVNRTKETALHTACKKDNVDVVTVLLHATKTEYLAELVTLTDRNSETALHFAAKNGHEAIVKLLMSLGEAIVSPLVMKVSDRYTKAYTEYSGGTALHEAPDSKVATQILRKLDPDVKELLLHQPNKCGQTALHTASEKGRYSVIEYILSEVRDRCKLVFFSCDQGNTPLHHSANINIARLFLDAIDPHQRELLIAKKNLFNETVLHRCCTMNDSELVDYFLSLKIDIRSLIFTVSAGKKENLASLEGTALHYAGNEAVAKMLISALDKGDQSKLVFTMNRFGATALHVACHRGHFDVVSYLLTLDLDIRKLIFMTSYNNSKPIWKDVVGTALHCASDVQVAELLLKLVGVEDREKLLFQLNQDGESPLHRAAEGDNGAMLSLVKYYLSSVSNKLKLLSIKSPKYGTALHAAASDEIVACLLDEVGDSNQESFIFCTNDSGDTALHTYCKAGIIGATGYLLQRSSEITLQHTTDDIENAIREVCILGSSDHVPSCSYTPDHFHPKSVSESLLLTPNRDGNTPLMLAIDSGSVGLVKRTISYILKTQIPLPFLLEYRNKFGQNSFHLAARNMNSETLGVELGDYVNEVDLSSVMIQDCFGNSPLHYVAGMSNTKLFAKLLMSVSLEMRRFMINQRNVNSINMQAIAERPHDQADNFTLRSIHNDSTSKSLEAFFLGFMSSHLIQSRRQEYSIPTDPRLLSVMMYATLNYSLVDSLALEPAIHSSIRKLNSGSLYIDELAEDYEMSQKQVKEALWNLDSHDRHGQPKVVVRRTLGNPKPLAPPGPDFLLIDVTVEDSENLSNSEWMNQLASITGQKQFIEKFKTHEEVLHISVNSTLGKHTPARCDVESEQSMYDSITEQPMKESAGRRGHGLILCIKEGRDEWRVQYDDVLVILEDQLCLSVNTCFDPNVKTMQEEIENLANNSDDQGSLAVLVVLAHGDLDGNIYCAGDEVIAVQNVIKAFSSRNQHHLAKMIMLSFCRGGITPGFNRVSHSFETSELPALAELSDFSPVKRKLPSRERFREYCSHPFPGVSTQPNCYLLFTTLPDSKSPRENITFKEMRKYLNEKVSAAMNVKQEAVRMKPSSVPERVCKPNAQVEVVDFFTDLTGVVRERSQFCTYLNYCYSVDKGSKPVILSVTKEADMDDKFGSKYYGAKRLKLE